jgi:Gas vesicle synthesis protein GvpL/GvpF
VGLFIYAIVAAEACPVHQQGDGAAPALAGILDAPVYALKSGPLAAMVSDCPLATLRAERKHIAASQRVLAALHRESDLLPMAFGSITGSEAACRRFLDEHRETLCAQLSRVAGAVEMGLSLALDGVEAIPFLLARTPELRAARERTFGRRAAPSYNERLRLGELCEEALERYRTEETARLVAILAPSCRETLSLPLRRDGEIARLAMLVPRPEVGAFEVAVAAAAPSFSDELSFHLSGPWPAHNFVHLSL